MYMVEAETIKQIRFLVDDYYSTRGKPIDSLPLPNVLRRIRDAVNVALSNDADPIVERARSLAVECVTEATGEDRVCCKCGSSVLVRDGDDWNDGDWCHPCWQMWGEKAREFIIDLANKKVRTAQ